MSGLLQRLAIQALGGAGRIRPAAAVRAQVPIAIPASAGPVAGASVAAFEIGAPAWSPPPETAMRDLPQPRAGEPETGTQRTGSSQASTTRDVFAEVPPPPLASQPSLPPAVVVARESPAAERPLPPMPPPMLGEAMPPRVTVVAGAPPAEPRGGHRDAAREAPTEVHVHIGRIEVTAQQAPSTPAKRPREPRHPTTALTEFLARRGRP